MGMSKQRQLPPDIFTDEHLLALPIEARMTAIGLRMHADDFGRESAIPRKILGNVWPENPEITEDMIIDHLLLLDGVGYIGIYSVGPRTYYAVRIWPAVSHPNPSGYPPPPPELFQKFAGDPLANFSAWEREGEREGEEPGEGGEESPRWRSSGIPPSPFCKVHQPNGIRGNCRHCGTARLAHEQWIFEHQADVPTAAGKPFAEQVP